MNRNFEQIIDDYILKLGAVEADETRLEGYRVYRLSEAEIENRDQLIFAIVKTGSFPVMIDLLCDRKLADNLRAKYESVVPSKLMDERNWNRVICSGQLTEEEVLDLVNLAYQMAKAN